MKNNRWLHSIAIASVIEASLAGMLISGGPIGPCGPSNHLGFVGMLAHFPGAVTGMPVMMLLGSAGTDYPYDMSVALVILFNFAVLILAVAGVKAVIEIRRTNQSKNS